MASLFNTRISDTYVGLIKSLDNAAISATLKQLSDGSGNSLGIYVNTSGDFKVNGILEWGSLKDTGEDITITKFVDEADGIANNDNDTTIPTSAAIIDYVSSQITLEDLDFSGDSGSGSVDLDSQTFAIVGTTNEIETSASNQQLQIGIVTNPTLSGNVTITGDLNISQGEIINIGTDFDLYETATGAYIQYSSNPVIFNGSGDVIFRKQGSEEKTAVFTPQGSAKLYYDNSLKLETTTNGLTVTGKISSLTDPTDAQDAATKAYVDSQVGANNELSEVLANGNTTGGTDISVSTGDDITFADSSKAIFGAGSDLQIYHDGSTQDRIESSSSFMILESSNFIVRNNGGTEDYAKFLGNGAVELYYNGSKKFETSNVGVAISGNTYLTSGSFVHFDNGGSNDYAIRKQGTTLEFRTGGTYNFLSGNATFASNLILSDYGSGTHTGTATQRLGVDSSGNVIEIPIGAGALDGSGTAGKLAKFTDSDTLGDSIITESSNLIQIGSISSGSLNEATGVKLAIIGDSGGTNDGLIITRDNGSQNQLDQFINIYHDGTSSFLTSGGTSTHGTFDFRSTNDKGDTTTSRLSIDASGNSTFAGTILSGSTDSIRKSVNDSVMTISGGNATNVGANYSLFGGTHASLANIHRWRIGGSEAMRLDSSGRLGIGRTPTSNLLEVADTIKLTDLGTGEGFIGFNTNGQKLAITAVDSVGAGMKFEVGASERMRIDSDGDIQARRPRSNTAGDVALSIQPSDSTIHYGFRIDQATNSLNLDRVGTGNFLTIDGTGNVGIGESSPSAKVHVQGTNSGVLIDTSTAYTPLIKASGTLSDLKLSSVGNGGNLVLEADCTTASIIQFNNGGSERMRLDSSGNLAVGGTSANGKLNVFSNGSSDDVLRINADDARGASRYALHIIDSDPNSRGSLRIATTSGASITTTNAVGIGESSPQEDLHITGDTPAIRFTDSDTSRDAQIVSIDGNLRFDADNSNAQASTNIAFRTDGTERMRIESDGQVSLRTAGAHLMFQNTVGTAPYIANAGTGYADLTIATGGTERMRITSGGEVSIGTASAIELLNLASSGSAGIEMAGNSTTLGSTSFLVGHSSSNIAYVYQRANESLIFGTNNTERARITAGGDLLVGTTDNNVTNNSTSGGEGINLGVAGIKGLIGVARWQNAPIYANRMGNDGTAINIGKDGTIVGVIGTQSWGIGTASPTAHNSGRLLHIHNPDGNSAELHLTDNTSGSASTDGSVIHHNASNLYIQNHEAGNIQFYNNGSERARITSDGGILMNTTTTGNGVLRIDFNDASSSPLNYGATITAGRTNSSVAIGFENPNGLVGSIQTSASATSYNTSSDYRLKEDLKDFNALDIASKIKMYDFKWKADDSRSYGVMAHELEEVLPQAVSGEKDGEEMQQVDYSKLVPILLKSIQELKAEIDELKNNV